MKNKDKFKFVGVFHMNVFHFIIMPIVCRRPNFNQLYIYGSHTFISTLNGLIKTTLEVWMINTDK